MTYVPAETLRVEFPLTPSLTVSTQRYKPVCEVIKFMIVSLLVSVSSSILVIMIEIFCDLDIVINFPFCNISQLIISVSLIFLLTPSTLQWKFTWSPTHLVKRIDGFKTILAVCNVIVTMKPYILKKYWQQIHIK